MPWRDWAALVTARWQKLLADPNIDERAVQKFLERHPCMVPFDTAQPWRDEVGDHGSIHYAVFAEPNPQVGGSTVRISCIGPVRLAWSLRASA